MTPLSSPVVIKAEVGYRTERLSQPRRRTGSAASSTRGWILSWAHLRHRRPGRPTPNRGAAGADGCATAPAA